jgi:hypothetical protein
MAMQTPYGLMKSGIFCHECTNIVFEIFIIREFVADIFLETNNI